MMTNFFSVMDHKFDTPLVAKIRSQVNSVPSATSNKGILEHLVWSIATMVREEIRASLDLGTKNKYVGLMGLIPDWRPLARTLAKRQRARSWLVTNLGLLDGASTQGVWTIDRALFAISAEVIGAALHICPITV